MATRRRKSGGWLAWWCAPVGSGPRGSRSRSRGGSSSNWGPTSLAWWLAKPGSAAPARVAAHDRPVRVRGSKGTCPLCGKGARCTCRMVRGEPIRRRRRPSGAPPYAYPPDFRAQGAVWCGSCRHRINTYTGHCSNTRCPR